MANNHHPECYGTLFPDVLHLPEDRPASGTVFTVLFNGRAECTAVPVPSRQTWSNGTGVSNAPTSTAVTSSQWRS